MKCPICCNGKTQPGRATVTLEREGLTLVVRNVPARGCDNCGEEFVDEADAARILATASDAQSRGTEVEVRDYVDA